MPGIDGKEMGVCLVALGGEADWGAFGDALGATGAAGPCGGMYACCGGGCGSVGCAGGGNGAGALG